MKATVHIKSEAFYRCTLTQALPLAILPSDYEQNVRFIIGKMYLYALKMLFVFCTPNSPASNLY